MRLREELIMPAPGAAWPEDPGLEAVSQPIVLELRLLDARITLNHLFAVRMI